MKKKTAKAKLKRAVNRAAQERLRERMAEIPCVVSILDEGEDLDGLYSTFGVDDRADVESILSGSVGEAEW